LIIWPSFRLSLWIELLASVRRYYGFTLFRAVPSSTVAAIPLHCQINGSSYQNWQGGAGECRNIFQKQKLSTKKAPPAFSASGAKLCKQKYIGLGDAGTDRRPNRPVIGGMRENRSDLGKIKRDFVVFVLFLSKKIAFGENRGLTFSEYVVYLGVQQQHTELAGERTQIELEDMTHEELATYARQRANWEQSEDLREAARALQAAVDDEADSEDLADDVIRLLRCED